MDADNVGPHPTRIVEISGDTLFASKYLAPGLSHEPKSYCFLIPPTFGTWTML